MVYPNITISFEEMLLFVSDEDPMLSMLKWLYDQLLEAEVTAKVNAEKSERHPERTGYRSSYRVRRFNILG
jgi:putative transposase